MKVVITVFMLPFVLLGTLYAFIATGFMTGYFLVLELLSKWK